MALAAAPEISGFRALSPLGYGPTSTIYSAQGDALGGRWVALTVYTTTLANERAQRRFDRAFEIARRLGTHPHVVTMLECGLTFDRQPYVATEIYEKGTLQGRLESRQALPVDEVLHMGVLLAGALETAHRAEVVHGGIHPARVLLSNDGQPALADLALVELVDRGGLAALVSPISFHAAPEVLEAQAITPVTDVYALASTLFAALAGRAPYQRGDDDTTASLLVRILHHDVPKLSRGDVPGSLEDALRRALRPDPGDRQARVLAFARELQSCQKELGLPVTEPVVLDVAGSIRLAANAASPEPRRGGAPVVEPAPPSAGTVQRVFIPAPENIPTPGDKAPSSAPAAAAASPSAPPASPSSPAPAGAAAAPLPGPAVSPSAPVPAASAPAASLFPAPSAGAPDASAFAAAPAGPPDVTPDPMPAVPWEPDEVPLVERVSAWGPVAGPASASSIDFPAPPSPLAPSPDFPAPGSVDFPAPSGSDDVPAAPAPANLRSFDFPAPSDAPPADPTPAHPRSFDFPAPPSPASGDFPSQAPSGDLPAPPSSRSGEFPGRPGPASGDFRASSLAPPGDFPAPPPPDFPAPSGPGSGPGSGAFPARPSSASGDFPAPSSPGFGEFPSPSAPGSPPFDLPAPADVPGTPSSSRAPAPALDSLAPWDLPAAVTPDRAWSGEQPSPGATTPWTPEQSSSGTAAPPWSSAAAPTSGDQLPPATSTPSWADPAAQAPSTSPWSGEQPSRTDSTAPWSASAPVSTDAPASPWSGEQPSRTDSTAPWSASAPASATAASSEAPASPWGAAGNGDGDVRSPFAGVQTLDLGRGPSAADADTTGPAARSAEPTAAEAQVTPANPSANPNPANPEAPPHSGTAARALPVIVLVALVVVLGAGLAWAVTTHDPVERDRAAINGGVDPGAEPPADQEAAPIDVTAVENPEGVQLDWDGGADGEQVVLVLSETEQPRLLDAETGTALLVPGNSLAARSGYCFAVTEADTGAGTDDEADDPATAPSAVAASLPETALTSAGCIRGASPSTVRRG